MEALAVALLIPLIKKLVDFVRYARARDWNGVVTQSIAWGLSIAVSAAAAQTSWAGDITLFNASLADANFFSQVFLGLLLGSSASLAVDTLKAVDNKQTAEVPTLLPSPEKPA